MIFQTYDDFVIRKLEIEDITAIVDIYELITGEQAPDEDELESRLDFGDSLLCIGAEARGKLVGFILGEVRRGEFGETEAVGWIGLLGVHPQYRNMQIGRAMGQELINQFKGIGVKTVRTTVTNTNTSLLKYFMNLGLKPADWTILEARFY